MTTVTSEDLARKNLEVTESLVPLVKDLSERMGGLETRMEKLEEHVLELPTLREIAGTVRHIVEESRS